MMQPLICRLCCEQLLNYATVWKYIMLLKLVVMYMQHANMWVHVTQFFLAWKATLLLGQVQEAGM